MPKPAITTAGDPSLLVAVEGALYRALPHGDEVAAVEAVPGIRDVLDHIEVG